ncbi:hypothetical protein SNEBB_008896 [Seison nebaliae]|nr:hypothetical protein SNEBB_008896 [Seison nebaliae]
MDPRYGQGRSDRTGYFDQPGPFRRPNDYELPQPMPPGRSQFGMIGSAGQPSNWQARNQHLEHRMFDPHQPPPQYYNQQGQSTDRQFGGYPHQQQPHMAGHRGVGFVSTSRGPPYGGDYGRDMRMQNIPNQPSYPMSRGIFPSGTMRTGYERQEQGRYDPRIYPQPAYNLQAQQRPAFQPLEPIGFGRPTTTTTTQPPPPQPPAAAEPQPPPGGLGLIAPDIANFQFPDDEPPSRAPGDFVQPQFLTEDQRKLQEELLAPVKNKADKTLLIDSSGEETKQQEEVNVQEFMDNLRKQREGGGAQFGEDLFNMDELEQMLQGITEEPTADKPKSPQMLTTTKRSPVLKRELYNQISDVYNPQGAGHVPFRNEFVGYRNRSGRCLPYHDPAVPRPPYYQHVDELKRHVEVAPGHLKRELVFSKLDVYMKHIQTMEKENSRIPRLVHTSSLHDNNEPASRIVMQPDDNPDSCRNGYYDYVNLKNVNVLFARNRFHVIDIAPDLHLNDVNIDPRLGRMEPPVAKDCYIEKINRHNRCYFFDALIDTNRMPRGGIEKGWLNDWEAVFYSKEQPPNEQLYVHRMLVLSQGYHITATPSFHHPRWRRLFPAFFETYILNAHMALCGRKFRMVCREETMLKRIRKGGRVYRQLRNITDIRAMSHMINLTPLNPCGRNSQPKNEVLLKHNLLGVCGYLSSGGYGTVVLAKTINDKGREDMVVLKIVPKHKFLKSFNQVSYVRTIFERLNDHYVHTRDKIFAERNTLLKLRAGSNLHYNSVPLWMDHDDCYMFIACELAECGDLLEVIRFHSVYSEMDSGYDITSKLRRIPEVCVKHVMAMMMYGLKELHSLGIIHSDFKTGNILVYGNGLIKITDYGLVIEKSKLRPGRSADQGTPRFIAPEGKWPEIYGGFDEARDYYALGATVHQMMYILPLYNYSIYAPWDRYREITASQQEPDVYDTPLSPELITCITSMTNWDITTRVKDYESIKMLDFLDGVDWASIESGKSDVCCPSEWIAICQSYVYKPDGGRPPTTYPPVLNSGNQLYDIDCCSTNVTNVAGNTALVTNTGVLIFLDNLFKGFETVHLDADRRYLVPPNVCNEFDIRQPHIHEAFVKLTIRLKYPKLKYIAHLHNNNCINYVRANGSVIREQGTDAGEIMIIYRQIISAYMERMCANPDNLINYAEFNRTLFNNGIKINGDVWFSRRVVNNLQSELDLLMHWQNCGRSLPEPRLTNRQLVMISLRNRNHLAKVEGEMTYPLLQRLGFDDVLARRILAQDDYEKPISYVANAAILAGSLEEYADMYNEVETTRQRSQALHMLHHDHNRQPEHSFHSLTMGTGSTSSRRSPQKSIHNDPSMPSGDMTLAPKDPSNEKVNMMIDQILASDSDTDDPMQNTLNATGILSDEEHKNDSINLKPTTSHARPIIDEQTGGEPSIHTSPRISAVLTKEEEVVPSPIPLNVAPESSFKSSNPSQRDIDEINHRQLGQTDTEPKLSSPIATFFQNNNVLETTSDPGGVKGKRPRPSTPVTAPPTFDLTKTCGPTTKLQETDSAKYFR